MAITAAQIKTAVTTSQDLAVAVEQCRDFIKAINDMAQNNWINTQTIGGQQVALTVDAATQTALLATYASLKTTIQGLYAQLP